MANIVSKVPGKSRVEKLYVNFTGKEVEAGEPLAELYSPELSQAIQELLDAPGACRGRRPRRRPPRAASLLGDRREMVRLSAEKLRRWGITQAQIDEILSEGEDRLHDPDPLADRRARVQEERRRGPGGAGRLPDVRGRRPAHRLGPGPGLRASAGPGPRGAGGRGDRRGVPGRDVPRQGRVHPAAPRPGDPDRRGPVRPGQPRPPAPARDVRHGDARRPPVADTPAFRTRVAAAPAAGRRADWRA